MKDLKKVLKKLNKEDRIKLLIKNRIVVSGSDEKEYLITKDQEDELVEECVRDGSFERLNYIWRLLNISNASMIDINTAILQLELTRMRCDYVALFDFTDPLNEKKSNIKITKDKRIVPSDFYQQMFVQVINAYKALVGTMYIHEYLCELAGMDLVDKDGNEILQKAKDILGNFPEEGGTIRYIMIFSEFVENEILKESDLCIDGLYKALKDIDQIMVLSEEEKLKIQKRVDKVINKE